MIVILLFHHAQGLTDGVIELADRLRGQGHVVHTPDLYEGRRFDDLDAGVGHAEEVGFGTIIERGVASAEALPTDLVYIGISLGVLPAQKLAQSRPGAVAAVLVSACVPPEMLDSAWPTTVPLQVHGMEDDEVFAGEGDLDAARELVEGHPDRALFLYPGDGHLFVDTSLPDYDQGGAELVIERILTLLGHHTGPS